MHVLNQQIQRHPLKPKSVIRGQACIVMLSEPTSYPNRLIMEVMYIYEKTNTNLMRDPIQEVDI